MSEHENPSCPCDLECPLQNAFRIIGGKWKVPIICVIANTGSTRYSVMQKKVTGITDTMLAASLKELQKDGMIERIQYNEMPLRVEYVLTDKSKSLIPLLGRIAAWEMNNRKNED